jgi:hypothetical protein
MRPVNAASSGNVSCFPSALATRPCNVVVSIRVLPVISKRSTGNGALGGSVPLGDCSIFKPLLLEAGAGGGVGCACCRMVPAPGAGGGGAAQTGSAGHTPSNTASKRRWATRSRNVFFKRVFLSVSAGRAVGEPDAAVLNAQFAAAEVGRRFEHLAVVATA